MVGFLLCVCVCVCGILLERVIHGHHYDSPKGMIAPMDEVDRRPPTFACPEGVATCREKVKARVKPISSLPWTVTSPRPGLRRYPRLSDKPRSPEFLPGAFGDGEFPSRRLDPNATIRRVVDSRTNAGAWPRARSSGWSRSLKHPRMPIPANSFHQFEIGLR